MHELQSRFVVRVEIWEEHVAHVVKTSACRRVATNHGYFALLASL